MQAKLIITFENLSEPNFLAKAELINTSLTGNANFPPPFPAEVPTLAQLAAAFTAYQTAYNAATGHDQTAIATRNTARIALTTILKKLAPHLETASGGVVAKLTTTGYDLRHDIVQGTGTTPLAAPADFKITRGKLSGVLLVHARILPGAGSYQAQTTDGDPTVPANWKDAGTFVHCSHIELTALVPGKTYSVRLRGIGSHGPGAWTDHASLMVV